MQFVLLIPGLDRKPPHRSTDAGTTAMSDLTITRLQSAQPARHYGTYPLSSTLRQFLRTYLTRPALLELTPHQRADIGVSLHAAVTEAARLPWNANPGPNRRSTGGVIAAIQRALERSRTRHLISRLDARELSDIGVSPSEAQAEATKSLWRV
jgi:uncharacterized protein YjiS (DUF1127 family)